MKGSRNLCRIALPALVTLTACQSGPSHDDVEAAKQSIDCQHETGRIVIRFDQGEARLLMPDATRVVLYQVSAPSGVRYLNGDMELRSVGPDIQLVRNGVVEKLTCKQFEIPKKEG